MFIDLLCVTEKLAAFHKDKMQASTHCAPVRLLLKLPAMLITAHTGVTDHSHAYLLIPYCDEPSMKIHIGCWLGGQSQKNNPSHLNTQTEVLSIAKMSKAFKLWIFQHLFSTTKKCNVKFQGFLFLPVQPLAFM